MVAPVGIGRHAVGTITDVDGGRVVLVPADVPDLPGLVLAKLFRVLHRTIVPQG